MCLVNTCCADEHTAYAHPIRCDPTSNGNKRDILYVCSYVCVCKLIVVDDNQDVSDAPYARQHKQEGNTAREEKTITLSRKIE